MPKTGLNSHCPCGSRKKYKKCCMPQDERKSRVADPGAAANAAPPLSPPAGPRLGVAEGMPPYVLAKFVEESEDFARMQRKDPARAALYWTPGRIRTIETGKIVEKLRDLGIDGTQEAFLALSEGRNSAWDVSDVWRRQSRRELSRFDDDFLGLAACELWLRYRPTYPSIEMLDDWMQDGYGLSALGKPDGACDLWEGLWAVIRSRLRPEMRTCDEASVVFTGTQCIFNWVQDFAEELRNAAQDAPKYGEMGAAFCRQILDQFTGEDDLFRTNFRADLGELLFHAGQAAEGERVLLDIIRDYPDRSQGYIRLAELLSCGTSRTSPPRDLPGAIKILEDALALPVGDAADYDVELRLEDLRKELAARSGA